MITARDSDEGVTFEVRAQPRASRERVGPVVEGRLKVAVTAAPVEGEANAAVVAALARALDVPRGAVEIVRGPAGRVKLVRVRGLTAAELRARLG